MTPSYRDPILILTADQQVNSLLEKLLQPEGYTLQSSYQIWRKPEKFLLKVFPGLVILGEKLPDGSGMDFAREISENSPTTAILLFVYQESAAILKQAIQVGVKDTFCLPMSGEDLAQTDPYRPGSSRPAPRLDAAGNPAGNCQFTQPDDRTGNAEPVEPVHCQPT